MGWRGDVRTNSALTCEAFMAANPTLVDRVYRKRPESLVETRAIHIGTIGEAIRHDMGTRQRTATVEIIVSRHLSDNEETGDDLEEMADGLIDWLTDHPRAIGANTIIEPIRDAEVEIAEGPMFIPAIAIICSALILEGRT